MRQAEVVAKLRSSLEMRRTCPPCFWTSCLAQVYRITTVSVRSGGLAPGPARQLVSTRGRKRGSSQQSPLPLLLLPPQKDDGKLRIEIRIGPGRRACDWEPGKHLPGPHWEMVDAPRRLGSPDGSRSTRVFPFQHYRRSTIATSIGLHLYTPCAAPTYTAELRAAVALPPQPQASVTNLDETHFFPRLKAALDSRDVSSVPQARKSKRRCIGQKECATIMAMNPEQRALFRLKPCVPPASLPRDGWVGNRGRCPVAGPFSFPSLVPRVRIGDNRPRYGLDTYFLHTSMLAHTFFLVFLSVFFFGYNELGRG